MVRFSSGSPYEPVVGYSRAVQARFILKKILAAVAMAGGKPEHVVRTRMFVTDISRWEEIGRAHGEVFRDIRPVTTMVEMASLIAPEYLVEIEATSVVEESAV